MVLTHRPLFDLYLAWDSATMDATQAIDLLVPYDYATLLYRHMDQEHYDKTEHTVHHAPGASCIRSQLPCLFQKKSLWPGMLPILIEGWCSATWPLRSRKGTIPHRTIGRLGVDMTKTTIINYPAARSGVSTTKASNSAITRAPRGGELTP